MKLVKIMLMAFILAANCLTAWADGNQGNNASAMSWSISINDDDERRNNNKVEWAALETTSGGSYEYNIPSMHFFSNGKWVNENVVEILVKQVPRDKAMLKALETKYAAKLKAGEHINSLQHYYKVDIRFNLYGVSKVEYLSNMGSAIAEEGSSGNMVPIKPESLQEELRDVAVDWARNNKK